MALYTIIQVQRDKRKKLDGDTLRRSVVLNLGCWYVRK